MGVLLFFTMSFFIFIAGVAAVSITFYYWYKVAQEKKQIEGSQKS